MRGTIIKRGDSYRIKISLGKDSITGKYVSHYETVNGNKKNAEKRLNELIHQHETGTFIKPDKATVADHLRKWLKDYAYANLSPNTALGYESIVLTHLIPAIGSIPLTQLKPELIQRYISDKLSHGRVNGQGGLTSQTVRHHVVCLHTALQNAVKMGMLVRNPVEAITIPRAEHQEMHTMNESDIHLLLELARPSQYYSLFYTALFTGMRRSELLALRWQDIDLLLLHISVNRSLHQIKGGQTIFRQPKTEKSRRLVSLTPSTVSVLKEHQDVQNNLRESLGIPRLAEDDMVFCQYNGKPLLPNTVTHNWIKLVRRAGLTGIRFHDARHTHASLMLKQGVHPKIVQERLGHSSIQITLDTYSHVTPGLQQAAANKFDDMILSKT
ncbi:tyrosine-type recombinase/integrase [Chloroflexota bacterium]